MDDKELTKENLRRIYRKAESDASLIRDLKRLLPRDFYSEYDLHTRIERLVKEWSWYRKQYSEHVGFTEFSDDIV